MRTSWPEDAAEVVAARRAVLVAEVAAYNLIPPAVREARELLLAIEWMRQRDALAEVRRAETSARAVMACWDDVVAIRRRRAEAVADAFPHTSQGRRTAPDISTAPRVRLVVYRVAGGFVVTTPDISDAHEFARDIRGVGAAAGRALNTVTAQRQKQETAA